MSKLSSIVLSVFILFLIFVVPASLSFATWLFLHPVAFWERLGVVTIAVAEYLGLAFLIAYVIKTL